MALKQHMAGMDMLAEADRGPFCCGCNAKGNVCLQMCVLHMQ